MFIIHLSTKQRKRNFMFLITAIVLIPFVIVLSISEKEYECEKIRNERKASKNNVQNQLLFNENK